MAQGDITKQTILDQVIVQDTWFILERKKIQVLEELADGSKQELSSNFLRATYQPIHSHKDDDGKWVHVETDTSKLDAETKKYADLAWTDDVKAAFKTFMESCHSMYIPITERVISRLWMEMQEHLETSGEENFTPQLAAEIFAAASMHYDIHPPSKSEINKLIADRPNIKAQDDSDIDDDDEED